METTTTTTMRAKPPPNKPRGKLAKTIQKVISLRSATKMASNNSICLLNPNSCTLVKGEPRGVGAESERAIMEALAAKLFASVTSIKASYAELQTAQNPYNGDLIQISDQSVVDELRAISELKRRFLRKDLDLSPQITIMLAEVQEQQALMKTYEITIKKLGAESESKSLNASLLRTQLDNALSANRSLEKRLSSATSLALDEGLTGLESLKPTHFASFLQSSLKASRAFVKALIKEMESAKWDLDLAAKSIEPGASFSKPTHRCFAFESFVFRTMLEGFNSPGFGLSSESLESEPAGFFDEFKKLRAWSPRKAFVAEPESTFARFLRSKYLSVVHAKMECSVFGNLSQRKIVTSSGYPETPFFESFAEMARRVWLLHRLAFSFGQQVTVFQVRRGSRFSEVYMETRVFHEAVFSNSSSCYSGEISGVEKSGSCELRVGFTVVPGFKIGKTVFQSQVYLSPLT